MAVNGMIFGRVQVSGNRSLQVTTMHVKDLTGTLKVIWFRMPYLRNTFQKGGAVTLRGKIVRKRNELVRNIRRSFIRREPRCRENSLQVYLWSDAKNETNRTMGQVSPSGKNARPGWI